MITINLTKYQILFLFLSILIWLLEDLLIDFFL